MSGAPEGPDLGMVRVPMDAFLEIRLRLPRLPARLPFDGTLAGWPESALLPDLSGLHGQTAFARVHAGWRPDGLAFAFQVQVEHALRIRAEHAFQSDGVEVWVDTRDSRAARKPTRFCHHFLVLPGGRGADGRLPTVLQWNPGGARKDEEMADLSLVRTGLAVQSGRGYTLEVFLPEEVLVGYAPLETGALGIGYRVRSSVLGVQDLAFGERFPIWRNPSLWRSARLEGATGAGA